MCRGFTKVDIHNRSAYPTKVVILIIGRSEVASIFRSSVGTGQILVARVVKFSSNLQNAEISKSSSSDGIPASPALVYLIRCHALGRGGTKRDSQRMES